MAYPLQRGGEMADGERRERRTPAAWGLWVAAAAVGLLAVPLLSSPAAEPGPSGPEWHSSRDAKTGSRVAPGTSARAVFAERCAACHGATGRGDGAAAASLRPGPPRFSDPAWQASVTDAHIEMIIKYGGAAVGKSPMMPSHSDLMDPQLIAGLRTVVRAFER